MHCTEISDFLFILAYSSFKKRYMLSDLLVMPSYCNGHLRHVGQLTTFIETVSGETE